LASCWWGNTLPFGTSWFWKALSLVVVLHVGIVAGVVTLNLAVPEINGLPRVIFGFLGIVVFFEWRFALRIVETFRPSRE